MRLLKFHSVLEDPGEIRDNDLTLRMPRSDDFEQWSTLRQKSQNFLQPWEPEWRKADYKRTSFRQRIKRYQAELKSGKAVSLFVFIEGGETLAGGLTLSNIRRGVAQTCTLGYWMGERHAGKGIMKQAVQLTIPYIFDTLKLHRLEAAAIENNKRSIALLEKCGFVFEGKVRQYLKINGKWQDHRLYALLDDDPRL
jgi:ribosomal-protein-alanine N-acetyltransferase